MYFEQSLAFVPAIGQYIVLEDIGRSLMEVGLCGIAQRG